jgi:hypothetical protein
MYLVRVPRYKNILTGEYETIPIKDLQLINTYFDWKWAREIDHVACYSLKDWCGVWEADMPNKFIVGYYQDFYDIKKVYDGYTGELVEERTIFEELGRMVKMNQILNWLVKHVTYEKVTPGFHEISKRQLLKLYEAIKRIILSVTFDENDELKIRKNIAKHFLPVMDPVPVFWGPDEYDKVYTKQIIEAFDIICTALQTTDFARESLYFHVSY